MVNTNFIKKNKEALNPFLVEKKIIFKEYQPENLNKSPKKRNFNFILTKN